MIRITIIKKTASKETLRLTSIEELTEQIRQGKYAEQVQRLRTYYPLLNVQRNSDGEMGGVDEYTKTLPRILFALEQENRQGQRTTLSYTGLVLLEVNNLTGRLEAEAIRQGAAEIPHTLMAFVGADGQSVKIVCKASPLPLQERGKTEQLPTAPATVALFHENLYERARLTEDRRHPFSSRIQIRKSKEDRWHAV